MSTWRIGRGDRSVSGGRHPILPPERGHVARRRCGRARAVAACGARHCTGPDPSQRYARASTCSCVASGRYSGRSATARSSSTQGGGGTGLEVEQGAGDQVGEDPDAVDRADLEAGAGQQRGDLVGGEPGPGATGRRRVVVEQGEGLGEVAGHGAGDDGGVPLGDQQGERAAGAQHLADRGQGGGRVVDHLEHAVAEHHVGAAGGDQSGRSERSPCAPPTVDADLAGPAVQRGQGVGAGVDHGDPVAELGHPDREAAGAAADVERRRGVGRPRTAGQRVPHHGGAGAVARRSLAVRLTWRQP